MLDSPEAFRRRQAEIDRMREDANLAAYRDELIAVMSRLQSQAIDAEAIQLIEIINQKISLADQTAETPRPSRRKSKGTNQ